VSRSDTRAPYPRWRQLGYARRVPSGRLEPLVPQRPNQLDQQERVAAGHLEAGGCECILGGASNCGREQPGARCAAERLGPDDSHAMLGDERAEEPLVGARLARPHRRQHTQPESLKAAEQIEQEPQRGTVRPLRVIDDQQPGLPLGQVRRQPVETVERRPRVARADFRSRLERRQSQPGRPHQEIVPFRSRGT
jgi:hypothetical protein